VSKSQAPIAPATARQNPQARQGADRGGNRGASGEADLRPTAARGDQLDWPGDGRGDRHLAEFSATHLAGTPLAAASSAYHRALTLR